LRWPHHTRAPPTPGRPLRPRPPRPATEAGARLRARGHCRGRVEGRARVAASTPDFVPLRRQIVSWGRHPNKFCKGTYTMTQPTRPRIAPLQQVSASVVRWRGDVPQPFADELVAEEPLEIRVRALGAAGSNDTAHAETLAVILRTPGHDDELAAGFL